jgi:hypothetical protein
VKRRLGWTCFFLFYKGHGLSALTERTKAFGMSILITSCTNLLPLSGICTFVGAHLRVGCAAKSKSCTVFSAARWASSVMAARSLRTGLHGVYCQVMKRDLKQQRLWLISISFLLLWGSTRHSAHTRCKLLLLISQCVHSANDIRQARKVCPTLRALGVLD